MTKNSKPDGDVNRNIDRLVNQHTDALYSYALMRLGNADTAEDMVQDTFLAAFQNWESFVGDSSERTWLIGILRHKILDFFRLDSKRQDLDDETWRTEYFDKHEFRHVLLNCLKELSRIVARAFVMREIEGFNSEEICKHLEISQTNLWVRLHRARLQLRRCLEINWFS